ncbi:MAG: DUF4256 domain-containing protein [Clostridiaceae bacterium]|nr:DUF4256 domain-containing protein [Clostridiaceae bacterium]
MYGGAVKVDSKRVLTKEQQEEILKVLKSRFEENMNRHAGLEWHKVQAKLEADIEKLWSLYQMEKTGGQPDVTAYEPGEDVYIFCDCSKETPEGRRYICYDREAQEKRKRNKPQNNAIDMASEMGIEILNEAQYRELQRLGEFDTKTSSWIKTPEKIRKLGGALFCDRRYDTVFVYHNSAESYYSVRGFRGLLKV